MAITYCSNNPATSPLDAVTYFAYKMAKSLTPESSRASFAKEWPQVPVLERPAPDARIDLSVNNANQAALDALNDLLDFRELRQKAPPGSERSKGGLGGLIIEGEPGIGKSELVYKTLVARKKKYIELGKPDDLVFYKMPVGMPFTEKKELLLKAFHEGAVVVIDEINSAPMMERLLNDLLMGATPEGLPPRTPGFMIIGTQNPSDRAGRVRTSLALERRMEKVVIPDYSKEEMIAILVHKNLSPQLSKELVSEYVYLRRSGKPELAHLCFRDLINRAEQLLLRPIEEPVALVEEADLAPRDPVDTVPLRRSHRFFYSEEELANRNPFESEDDEPSLDQDITI